MLILTSWPKSVTRTLGEKVEGAISKKILNRYLVDFKDSDLIWKMITSIRSLRADYSIEPAKMATVTIVTKHVDLLESQREHIMRLGRLDSLTIQKEALPTAKDLASHFLEKTEVHLHLAGLIDLEKEKMNLSKEQETLSKLISSIETKLKNKEFVARAPEEVITGEREKLASYREKLTKIEQRLKNL